MLHDKIGWIPPLPVVSSTEDTSLSSASCCSSANNAAAAAVVVVVAVVAAVVAVVAVAAISAAVLASVVFKRLFPVFSFAFFATRCLYTFFWGQSDACPFWHFDLLWGLAAFHTHFLQFPLPATLPLSLDGIVSVLF